MIPERLNALSIELIICLFAWLIAHCTGATWVLHGYYMGTSMTWVTYSFLYV